jgi:hypothetical protein
MRFDIFISQVGRTLGEINIEIQWQQGVQEFVLKQLEFGGKKRTKKYLLRNSFIGF